MKVIGAVVFAAATVMSIPTSDACVPLENWEHELDGAFATDSVAPGAPTIMLGEVRPPGAAGDCTSSHVELIVSATDDRAPAERLGYDITILDETTPLIDDARIVDGFGASLYVKFSGLHRDLTEFPLNVEVRAVDLNGNMGPMTAFSAVVEVPEVPDDGGCSATGTSPGWLALAALALLRRRRR